MELPPVPPELENMAARIMSDPEMSARIMNIVNGMNNYSQIPGQSDEGMRMSGDNTVNSGSSSPDLSQLFGRLMNDPKVMGLVGGLMNGTSDIGNGKDDSAAYDGNGRIGEQSDNKPKRQDDNGRRGHDRDRIALLCALKPYLSEGRCRKIEGMIKILELVEFARTAHLLDNLLPGMIN